MRRGLKTYCFTSDYSHYNHYESLQFQLANTLILNECSIIDLFWDDLL